jgi:hypothetical protein
MSISARTRQSTWSTDAPEASGARNLGICLIGGLPHCFYRRAARRLPRGRAPAAPAISSARLNSASPHPPPAPPAARGDRHARRAKPPSHPPIRARARRRLPFDWSIIRATAVCAYGRPLLVRWPRVVSSAAMSRNDRRRPSRGSRGFQPLRRRKRKKSQEQTAPDPPSVEIATISSSSETTAVCQDWMVGEVDLRPLNNINRKSQGAGDSEALIGQRNL